MAICLHSPPRTFYNSQNSQGPVQVEGTEAETLLLHSPLVLVVKLQAIGARWWDHFSRQAVLSNFLEIIPNRILTECYKGINKVQYYESTMVLQRKEPKWSLRERCEGLGRFLELGPSQCLVFQHRGRKHSRQEQKQAWENRAAQGKASVSSGVWLMICGDLEKEKWV